jgi:hypothetical protein
VFNLKQLPAREMLATPDDQVAVLLVTEHWGPAIHTFLWIQRLFPGRSGASCSSASSECRRTRLARRRPFGGGKNALKFHCVTWRPFAGKQVSAQAA